MTSSANHSGTTASWSGPNSSSPSSRLLATRLASVAGVARVSAAERGFHVHLRDGVDASDAIRDLAAAVPVRRIEVLRPTLEDVFVRLAGAPAEGES